jgi:hypothetical protein
VREHDVQAYSKIRSSPLFVAHLQRLWTEGERVLAAAAPLSTKHGGLFKIDVDVLDLVYSQRYVDELDRLSIRHKKAWPGAAN